MANRSYLYVPGHRPDRFDKAAASGADAVIVDLEDAVPPAAKSEARAAAAEWLERPAAVPVWVRVNHRGDLLAEDLAMVAESKAAGAVIPKAGADACAASPVPVQALVETAEGVETLGRIARTSPVVRLALGEADLGAELGLIASVDGSEMWAIRSAVVVASAAAGLAPPVGPVPVDLDDDEALARTSRQLRGQGFGGRSVIHPRQVAVVNAAFTPDAAEVERARRILEAHEAAGEGAAATADGSFVDAAVVRQARRVLEQADP